MAVLPAMCRQSPAAEPAQCSLEDMERAHIARVLDAHAGNKTHAAKTLDIDYKTLLSKMKKYGLGG